VPNLVQSVAIADSEFSWLLGSDDLVVDGALAKVVALLREYRDVAGVTLNRLRVNPDIPSWSESDRPDELPADPEQVHLYVSSEDIFRNVGLSHDYMSTQIVNRAVWAEAVAKISERDMAHAGALAHLLVLGEMVKLHPRWIWYPEQLVHHTTGTSALDDELGHRYAEYLLAVTDGRSRVWTLLFGAGTPLFRAVMYKAFLRSTRPMALVAIKLSVGHSVREDVRLLARLPRYFYWIPRFWLVTIPLLLVPHQAFRLLRRAKRAGLGVLQDRRPSGRLRR
jgi:abequosyltransferase